MDTSTTLFIPHPTDRNKYVFKFVLTDMQLSRMMVNIQETYKTNNEGRDLILCVRNDYGQEIVLFASNDCKIEFSISKHNDGNYWQADVTQKMYDLLNPQNDLMARAQSYPGEPVKLLGDKLV